MEGHPMKVQHMIQDPPEIWLQRLKLYRHHIANCLDRAGGNSGSPAARKACQLGNELVAVVLSKTGRV